MTEPVPTVASPATRRDSNRLGRRYWRRRVAPNLVSLAIANLGLGCESEPVAVVHLSVGARPEEHRSFQPKSSLAEYTELPGFGAELRVVLSSHPITCESYLPLQPDQVIVTLTFSAPTGTTLGPGAYPWPGPRTEAPKVETPNAETPKVDEHPLVQVLPLIRLGKQSKEIPAGGLVELTEVKLDAQGTVRGLLRLEQPGAAGLPATSLLGSFAARWCRISTASGNERP
jgi:hypothetical protein